MVLKKKPLANKGNLHNGSMVPTVAASSNHQCIVFSFEFMDKKYCITECEKEDQLAFISNLKERGNQTWQTIQNAPKHGMGCETIPEDALRAALPSSLKNKKGLTLLALRFSGKKSMVGFRDNQIFHLIFFDRDFSLYRHS